MIKEKIVLEVYQLVEKGNKDCGFEIKLHIICPKILKPSKLYRLFERVIYVYCDKFNLL